MIRLFPDAEQRKVTLDQVVDDGTQCMIEFAWAFNLTWCAIDILKIPIGTIKLDFAIFVRAFYKIALPVPEAFVRTDCERVVPLHPVAPIGPQNTPHLIEYLPESGTKLIEKACHTTSNVSALRPDRSRISP